MKKYDNFTKQVNDMMKCAHDAINYMEKNGFGFISCTFSVSDMTSKPTKETNDLMINMLTIVYKNLEKEGYYTTLTQSRRDGCFVLYITKKWFYLDAINTLINMKSHMSKPAFETLFGRLYGLSDEEIKEEIGDVEEDE